jgi:hypothetical protein
VRQIWSRRPVNGHATGLIPGARPPLVTIALLLLPINSGGTMKYYLMERPDRVNGWAEFLISAADEDQARDIACAQVDKLKEPEGFTIRLIGDVPAWPDRRPSQPACHQLTSVWPDRPKHGEGDSYRDTGDGRGYGPKA